MSIIKCPVCRQQVSTMAGTCPHCGTKISGQLLQCPSCGEYNLVTQDKCSGCGAVLQIPREEESKEEERQDSVTSSQKKHRKTPIWKRLLWFVAVIGFILLCAAGYYFYHQQQMQQKEQRDYERLEGITNPEFYQQFLIDYPESKHYKEISDRMHQLQTETDEWKLLLQSINRANVSKFLQNHPNSLRKRACEDMLDSIDWQDALTIGSEEAVTDYLAKHPSGRYASDAAEKKNKLLLSKVTPEEKAMIRGTLEAFFSKAIGAQDIEAARAAIPDTMISFCGKQNANAETIIEYAREKMAKDVIGLHYIIEQQMGVHKETLPDGNTGFAVEVGLQETISRSDTNLPTSNIYRVNALLNQEQKIVRMNITK